MTKTTKQKTEIHKILSLTIPRIDEFSSRTLWEVSVWHTFIERVVNIKNPLELKSILNTIITPHERSVLLRRIATTNRILDGKSYREIAKELWCTPQMISMLKRALHETDYRSYYERGKTERKKKIYSTSHVSTKKKPLHKRRTKYGTMKVRV